MDRRVFSMGMLAAAPGLAAADPAVARQIQDRLDSLAAALVRGDPAGAAAVFADDALFMVPGGPTLSGRAAIERNYAERMKGSEYFSVAIKSEEVVVSGGWATERGSSVTVSRKRAEPKAARTRSHGKYMTLWRRGAGGQWLIQWDLPAAGQQPPETLPG